MFYVVTADAAAIGGTRPRNDNHRVTLEQSGAKRAPFRDLLKAARTVLLRLQGWVGQSPEDAIQVHALLTSAQVQIRDARSMRKRRCEICRQSVCANRKL